VVGLRYRHDHRLVVLVVRVLPELLAGKAAQLERRDAVAGDEAVRVEGRGVAGPVAVEHDRAAAAGTHEVQRRAEPAAGPAPTTATS